MTSPRSSGAVSAVPATVHAWTEVYRSDPEALPTQAPEWVAAACAGGPYEDASYLYEIAGQRFVLPAIRRRGLPGGGVDASFPEAWGIGGLVGPGQTAETIRAVIDDVRARRVAQMTVRPNPLHSPLWETAQRAAGVDVAVLEGHAHVLDLAPGSTAIWDSFHTTRRRNVRRAERSDLRVECDTTGRLLPVFHTLLEGSFERWAGQQGEPAVLARWRGNRRDPLQKFEAIATALGDRCRTWVAWHGERPAASLLVLQDRNSHYTRGAMDKEVAGPTRANDLLHWMAIQDAVASGCSHYHMGETRPGSSLARFKEGFGARLVSSNRYQIERWPIGRADRAVRAAAKRVLRIDDA